MIPSIIARIEVAKSEYLLGRSELKAPTKLFLGENDHKALEEFVASNGMNLERSWSVRRPEYMGMKIYCVDDPEFVGVL